MRVVSRHPCEDLRPWVKRFLVVEFAQQHADFHLPESGLFAAFPFRGACQLENGEFSSHALLTGFHDRVRRHTHSAGSAVVVAAFSPLGASLFVRSPLHEIENSTAPLAEFLPTPSMADALVERIVEASDHLQRIQVVENFFLSQLAVARAPDCLVSAAIDWIERNPPGDSMQALVRHIGLSQSALERRFRRAVGVPPKRFARVVRLHRAIEMCGEIHDFPRVAHVAGYSDQPHFIHDFKRMTGRTPEEYFAQAKPA